MEDVTVLVGTCDKYKNAWIPFCHGMAKYWPDRPWPVKVITNYSEPPCGEALKIGPDSSWTDATRRALQRVGGLVVLYAMEDAWLTALVDTDALRDFASVIERGSADHIRLCPTFRPGSEKHIFSSDERLFVFSDDAEYRVSLQVSLWRTSAFLGLLRGAETPWEFELRASIRSRGSDRFLCAREFRYFRYVHPSDPDWSNEPVLRGQWTDAAVKYAEREGLNLESITAGQSVLVQ